MSPWQALIAADRVPALSDSKSLQTLAKGCAFIHRRRRGQIIDIPGPGPTLRRMGDKSPKANRKNATQRNEKDNEAAKKKNAAIAAKQTPKK